MTYYIGTRIIDGKSKNVIIDENEKIVNRNPGKDELKSLVSLPKESYKRNKKWNSYTEGELLYHLRQFFEENDRSPKIDDFVNSSEHPGFSTYIKCFGSWNNAIKMAGLCANNRTRLTNEDLLNYIIQFHKENDRPPAIRDFDGNSKYPDSSIYWTRFGGFEKAKKIVGLDTDTMIRKGIALENNYLRGRQSELIVLEHFKETPIDLSGDNCNSSCDGICPGGKTYDVKSSALLEHKGWSFWHFGTSNKYKKAIEIYYFLAFNVDWTKLEHGWRVPGEIVENNDFHIGSKGEGFENMKKYDYTNQFTDILVKYAFLK